MNRTLWGVLALMAWTGCKVDRQSAPAAAVVKAEDGAATCRACHADIVAQHAETAHAHTSAPASEQTVRGSFAPGRNVLRTGNPALSFVMEKREGGLFHVSRDAARGVERADRFDVVFGSGRKGQTYLYWRGQDLLQLQVSWLREADAWMNGPGYTDGVLDLERVVMPRCVECHASAPLKPGDGRGFGVGCASCHGDGAAHVAWHSAHPGEKGGRDIFHPGKLGQARALEGCAVCHSGMRSMKTAAFSWLPGEPLDTHLGPPAPGRDVVDAHGNQVGLLAKTKCFQGSPGMTCSSCHDAHQTQRSPEVLAKACTGCHAAPKHSDPAISSAPSAGCVECHMPNVPSGLIRLQTPAGVVAQKYRSHAIGIYPPAAGQGR